ncbi:hypothetical protein F53441_11844 [Fusarium austroafricanum]|uniref:Ubiquitin-like protease family profile domain-containing protein n=1 Tax=Fusarium austroafricanum TaxID=2364996 RepID=A0A8H4K3T0_9HYPO|nr:hypothetical protein F53441_11844 [Fusarium austroafricanum]
MNALDRKEDGAGLGTTIQASSGTGTEVRVGSGAEHTVGADAGDCIPSSPAPHQSPSSKTSPLGGRQKKQKTSNIDYDDITAELSAEDEELQRKKSLASVDEGANKIRSQLTTDEKLGDDTVYIISQVFKLVLSSDTPLRILDTTHFNIDEKKIPSQLKHIPKSGEPIYIPLHYNGAEYWTSCVLLLESDSEPSSEINSIRLDFYDSSESEACAKKVNTFFTEWIQKHYPNSKLTLDQKEIAQQNDKTSCGVFVLETIRRLIASEDVTRTIELRDAKKCFLDMITSIDTNSPSPSTNLQVIEAIKALERKCDTSAIMDVSLSTTQEPICIQPSQEVISKTRSLCESEGITIAKRLSLAKKECKRITEEEERLKPELADARKDLGSANVNVLAVEEVMVRFSESITTDETTDDPPAGVHLQTTKDEPMSDGTLNPNSLVKNSCLNDMLDNFSCAFKNAASDLMQADRARIKDKLAEAMEKARYLEERNAQVELMSRIFSEAKLVIVWLGQSSPALERAIGLLDIRFPADTVSISVASAKDVCCQMSPAECTSLFEACGAAIWTRRWVKQEILLPRTTILCCGQASVSISVFLAVMDALVDYSTLHSHALPVSRSSSSLQADVSGEQQDEPETRFYDNNNLDQRHRQCANVLPFYHAIRFMQGQIQLPILLETFRDSVCTDFQDHVYAFRGLMDQGMSLRVDYKLSNIDMFLNTLDFVARTTHPQLRGTSAAERNFLVDIYRGFNLTPSDLETIFESHYTSFLVQVGYSFEMLRKDVSVWVFVDSITDPDEFVSSAWRGRELQGNCIKVLSDQRMHEYYTVLNQLRTDRTMSERGVWLYGLRSDCGPNLARLRAVYSPRWFYNCRRETAQLLNSMMAQGYPARALSFDPCGEDRELVDWLDEVKDHLVVMVTDRDDAAHQMQIFILPGCESEECLLQ